ncbi:uncharacterized protein UV8b_07195 [Ustilaginoidea virens]|uniref:Uncharacterized protein n=1 Tax=Ustilaginoidea virens TaxID=1159556 RepID=A0A8E5HWL3_USTVR|nr:uncharacterized protein UV8b_07195 [Ustilaginoidea virens]QUC22954.1 hypothetical protein UV8b_07195 [Ustilaginoidea virens]
MPRGARHRAMLKREHWELGTPDEYGPDDASASAHNSDDWAAGEQRQASVEPESSVDTSSNAAAAAAAAAAAVAPREPGPKRRRCSHPARQRTQKLAPGTPRPIPCEGCVKAAIAGKGARGRCVESDGNSLRCSACKAGNHPCRPCNPIMVPLVTRMLRANDEGNQKLYDQCRKSLRLQLLLINEPDSVYAETGPAPREPDVAPGTSSATVAAKKARVMALLEQVVDAILE